MWIKLLIKNWHFVVIALLLMSNALVVNMYLETRDELTVCSVNLKDKSAEVAAGNEKISEQNSAIGDLEAEGIVLRNKVFGLVKDFGIIENKYNDAIDKINNTEVPETCEGAMEWLVDQGKIL